MTEDKKEQEKKEVQEKKRELSVRDAIIIGSIIIAASVIAGAFIISSSISGIKITTTSSTTNQLQSYLQTLQKLPLPNISNIDPVYGNPDNTNVIVFEYSDYACPFCDEFYVQTFYQGILPNYIENGKIAWVYKVFPLYEIHPYANITSQYLTCVYEIYGFNTWEELANWSWFNFFTWDGYSSVNDVYNAFNQEAKTLGLNVSEIDQCVNSMEYYNEIYNSELNAMNTYGIDATPSFIIAVKTSTINYQQVQQVENTLNSLRQYGLSYSVFTTPDEKYIMFEFAGALPYSFFNSILQAITQ